MTRSWNVRQLLAQTYHRESKRNTIEENVSLTGTIESGDFKIDLDERTVILRDQELPLTSEEFDVLVFLAQHPQSLVTPRTIVAKSWTANRFRQAEFLRALISLRKKFDAARPGKHYLRIEPWLIYRFDPSSSA